MGEQKQASGRYHYEYVVTADGSPSVRMGSPEQPTEVMHHSGGALTESLYIYHSALRRALELGLPPQVLSVGLGLGYNEAIAAAEMIRRNRLSELRIASFEIIPVIRENYRAWLTGVTSAAPVPEGPDWRLLFTDVVQRVAAHFEIPPSELHAGLNHLYQNAALQLFGALEARPEIHWRGGQRAQFSCILFDAFSKKATPGLWEEHFLMELFKHYCAPKCVLATYAATGSLNRALRASGFQLLRRPGFQGKRESTWAERI